MFVVEYFLGGIEVLVDVHRYFIMNVGQLREIVVSQTRRRSLLGDPMKTWSET